MSVVKNSEKITVPAIIRKKTDGEKIAVLTSYEYTMAGILDESGIDIILVGDSVGMVVSGFDTTLPVTLDIMLYHTQAVRRAVQNALLVVDMPFLTYQASKKDALRNAGVLVQQGGAEAVKIEGGKVVVPVIKKLTDAGIPVMAHLGLTPQSINKFGKYHPVGRDTEIAEKMIFDAIAVEKAGAFSLVLEMVPMKLAEKISKEIKIPTIGIGSGPHCDGQVLVAHDMLGLYDKFKPKFVRRYAEINNEMRNAFRKYIEDVKKGNYPTEDESYQ